jgi:hypothetical protein
VADDIALAKALTTVLISETVAAISDIDWLTSVVADCTWLI